MKYVNPLWVFNFLLVLCLCGMVWFFDGFRKTNDKFVSEVLEKTEANRNTINYISAGMSLSEQRLRKVLQTEKIIKYYNPNLKNEFVNSLAMVIVDKASKYPNLTHIDLCALIAIESRFDPKALSRVGAKGLMQIMDQTAEFICDRFAWGYVPEISYDPEKNIMMGAFYFNYLLEWNKLDKEVALVNYNGGQVISERFKLIRLGDSASRELSIPLESSEYPKKFMKEFNFISNKFAFLPSDILKGSDVE